MTENAGDAKVVTYVLELPFALPVPDDWQSAPLLPRTPGWEGWTGENFWALLEWPGRKEIPAHLMPGTQIRVRRVALRTALPLRAADEAFEDKIRPLLNRRERAVKRLFRFRADRGLRVMRSVVSLTTFVAPLDVPEDNLPETELEWLHIQFDRCLGDLNRFLTALGLSAADWRVGRLGAGQLPPLLPIIIDHVSPGDSPGRWPIHLLVSIRPDLPEPANADNPKPDPAWVAAGIVSGANKGVEPYLEFFGLLQDAWADSLLGEPSRCVIGLGTAVEVLVSTTIREGGARLGWSDEEIAKGSGAWLHEQVTKHLARLFGKKIDLKDESGVWGAWWSLAHGLRNVAVHDGRRIVLSDAVRAKEATTAVIREIRADLAADEKLAGLAKGLKIEFADDEHDYTWKLVQVMPWSIRRAEHAQRRLERLMP
ncbi:MAG TPA: hypothetical protein VMH33_01555 [Solirubrobacterales bacterium]|nr:hypothetical protein [Solirubrobacterales bacterium]